MVVPAAQNSTARTISNKTKGTWTRARGMWGPTSGSGHWVVDLKGAFGLLICQDGAGVITSMVDQRK